MVKFDPTFVITKFTHFFKVTKITPMGRVLLEQFLLQNVHKGFRQPNPYRYRTNKEPVDKVYGLATQDLLEYRFHIGQLNPLQEFLNRRGLDVGLYRIDHASLHDPVRIDMKIREEWKLRERQPDVVEFILKPMESDHHSRLVTLPMGEGKGFISLWAISERKYRTALFILPQYIGKWAAEIKEKTTATDRDIMIVQGGDSLRGLIELGQSSRYHSSFVLFSMRTWTNFIDSYLLDRRYCIEDEYGCSPDEIFDLLGIGTVVFDEIHQHMHAVYKTLCFMNVDKVIGLSATFLSKDYFIDKMQRILFPKEIRFEEVKMKKYIRAYGISYSISNESMKKIRTTERRSSVYSQNAFEDSILKCRPILESYMELVIEVVESGFMDEYQPGYRCIIFVRKVEMCDTIVLHLRKKWPHLDIRRYAPSAGDPYENLMDPDIRVTTQIGAGTGHDIKGLMTTITLDNINSAVANIQTLGRLREPKEGTARYFSVYSESIKKHAYYAKERRHLLSDRVASYKEFKSNVSL
ncbi:MAG TPA: hypothetical protein VN843_01500 [Anaerolineales bacterium]|nr:hypothetical protein [Anaerolineales bacterium]